MIKVKKRCRVCGRFLVEAREKKTRSSCKCQELKTHLHTLFAVNTSNDITNTHFLPFAKVVLDKCLLATAHTNHKYSPFGVEAALCS